MVYRRYEHELAISSSAGKLKARYMECWSDKVASENHTGFGEVASPAERPRSIPSPSLRRFSPTRQKETKLARATVLHLAGNSQV